LEGVAVAPAGLEEAATVPRPQRIPDIAEVLRVEVTDLMKYARYLPDGEADEVRAEEPFHQLLGVVSRQASEEYRFRVGFSAWNTPVGATERGWRLILGPLWVRRVGTSSKKGKPSETG
jgi:hypothetical protein